MNNFLLSIGGIIIIASVISLLSKFFDISTLYYLPFVLWFTVLLIFNMFLEKEPTNIFMKNVK